VGWGVRVGRGVKVNVGVHVGGKSRLESVTLGVLAGVRRKTSVSAVAGRVRDGVEVGGGMGAGRQALIAPSTKTPTTIREGRPPGLMTCFNGVESFPFARLQGS
jgi:hypothetical protein